jgi:hypothetical protein
MTMREQKSSAAWAEAGKTAALASARMSALCFMDFPVYSVG